MKTHGNLDDLTGRVFGRLTVMSRAPQPPNANNTLWKCRCSCGKIRYEVFGHSLKSGKTTSCGCFNKEVRRKAFLKNNPNKTK